MEENKNVSCKAAARLISDSLERRLTLREKVTMNTHLAICKTCTFYCRQIKALKSIFHKYNAFILKKDPPQDRSLPSDAAQRIKESLREQGQD